jgi:hypothetical protein
LRFVTSGAKPGGISVALNTIPPAVHFLSCASYAARIHAGGTTISTSPVATS